MDGQKMKDMSENELVIQLESMKADIARFVRESNRRLTELENLHDDETEKRTIYEQQIKDLKDHISRMESGLHLDFKTTQDILKARLEHEMNIERARLDFEQKLGEKEAELRAENERMLLRERESREEFKKKLYLRIGGILTPILVALTAFIIKMIEGWG